MTMAVSALGERERKKEREQKVWVRYIEFVTQCVGMSDIKEIKRGIVLV